MAAHIVATIRIFDAVKFKAYLDGVEGLSVRHGGERLLAGPVLEYLEGQDDVGERVAVIRFPTREAAQGYIASAEYQAVKARREGAAHVVMRLLED